MNNKNLNLCWMPDPLCRRYCLFLIKDDGTKIKIIDPKYDNW